MSVPIWPHSTSPLIQMLSNALPRMQRALPGAKRLDAVGVGEREAFGVRQLAAALSLRPNNVPVPIWPHWIVPLIPIASHAPPRMERTLPGAKRLECGSLLPLSLYAQTTCLSP